MSCITGKYRAAVQLRILTFITYSRKVYKDPALTQSCALCAGQTGDLVVLVWQSVQFELYSALFPLFCSTLFRFIFPCSTLFSSFCSAVLCCSFCSVLHCSVSVALLYVALFFSALLCSASFVLFYSALLIWTFCSAVLCSPSFSLLYPSPFFLLCSALLCSPSFALLYPPPFFLLCSAVLRSVLFILHIDRAERLMPHFTSVLIMLFPRDCVFNFIGR